MTLALALIAGLFGLVIGSFLNVVVYRVPAGRSIAYPPSACGSCGTAIAPYDNVPVVSWLVLRGHCRTCHAAISPRYPLVEAGTALFFAGVAWFLAPRILLAPDPAALAAGVLTLVAYLFLAAISVSLALIDLDVHRLPNVLVLPAFVVGVVTLVPAALLAGDPARLAPAFIGAAAMLVAYLVMALAYPGGMGYGDVKLAGVLGLYLGFLGWGPLVTGALGAFVLGGLYSLVLLVTRRAGRRSGIPFGPWMLAGAWIGILLGDGVWRAYLSLFGLV